jgi:hypothetical protein
MEAGPPPDGHSPNAIRISGWKIPGIDNAEVVERSTFVRGDQKGVRVTTTRLEPRSGPSEYDVDHYKVVTGQAVHVWRMTSFVDSVLRFDIEGRVVCYQGVSIESYVDPTTRLGGAGRLVHFRFYDEDGDGAFEAREQSFDNQAVRLPKWSLPRATNESLRPGKGHPTASSLHRRMGAEGFLSKREASASRSLTQDANRCCE